MTPHLFFGTHEVRVLLPDQSIYAVYFTSEESALAAVARLDQTTPYRVAWATLNPLKTEALTPDTKINPLDLVREFHVVGDAHIARRVWLLLDFDPDRETHTNSTAEEKAGALAQAETCVSELTGLGWPAPTWIDSANGFHVRYKIELPNEPDALELVKAVTMALKARYPLIDQTMVNAGRPAKLPSTWSRKNENTPERPWRMSTLLSEGSQLVSEAQLRELAGNVPAGVTYAPAEAISDEESKAAKEWLLGYARHYDLATRTPARRITGGWKICIFCPFSEMAGSEHAEGDDTSTALFYVNGRLGFNCKHDHCAGKNKRDLVEAMQQRKTEAYLPEAGKDARAVIGGVRNIPELLHHKLMADFLDGNEDFRQVVDLDPSQLASWTGAQWQLRRETRLLHRAVSLYLADLYKRWPQPKIDPKTGFDIETGCPPTHPERMLLGAGTLMGVCKIAELHVPEAHHNLFDTDQFLLGLPDGLVADLRQGGIRRMLREDYVSRVLSVAPDAAHPTPRWTAFLDEITLGDSALADYLRQLAALCLTAYPQQTIFCLHGSGRNGKGSYLRILEGILGSMARMLRPRELAESKFGDDNNKRLMSNVEGARLVAVMEAKSDNLDLALLKTLTGGDTQNGASLYENARQVRPTWKLLLISNEKPKFPVDSAIRPRVKLIPFLANFEGREEASIDATMRLELPGILAELLALCPAIIANDCKLPQAAAVQDATADLFLELDLTTRFSNDCLVPGDHTTVFDMGAAVSRWLQQEDLYSEDAGKIVMAGLKKRYWKQYSVRKIGGKSVRCFVGLHLVDSLPKGVIVSVV